MRVGCQKERGRDEGSTSRKRKQVPGERSSVKQTRSADGRAHGAGARARARSQWHRQGDMIPGMLGLLGCA